MYIPSFQKAGAQAQATEIIVPWPAGGETDLLVRPIVPYLSKHLKRPVNVTNVPGSFGVTGVAEAAKRATDGASLVVVHDYLFSVKRSGKSSVDPLAELIPVCGLISHPSVLGGHSARVVGVDLKSLLKGSQPIEAAWTSGPTSTNFMMLALIARDSGANLRFNGFRSKAAAISALNDGEVTMAEISPEVLADKANTNIVPLAVSSEQRDPLLPATPTLKELGINVSYSVLRGLAVPRGTPEAVRAQLEQACLATARESALNAELSKLGARTVALSGAQFAEALSRSRSLYASGVGPAN